MAKMSDWSRLERFLRTDPRDAGCAQTFEVLDVYAELMLGDAEPEFRLPRVAAHLRACRPCAEDLEGLLVAVSSSS
jgi:hypothetical protein